MHSCRVFRLPQGSSSCTLERVSSYRAFNPRRDSARSGQGVTDVNESLRRILPNRLIGDEPLHSGGNPIRSEETVLNFWQWSASDLIDNTQRGALAEYIVALAVGAADDTRRPGWTSYDVKTPAGIKVEVKSSAYIQNWAQKKESTPRFSIRQAFAWNPDTDTLDLLDVSQWDFYILPTAALKREAKEQKTIGLASLYRLGARKVSFGQIHDTLRDVLTTSKTP